MKKINFSVYFFGILFLLFIFIQIKNYFYWPKTAVRLKDQDLQVLVASTPSHRYKGLSKRKDLGEYDGMLFVFSVPDKYGFVMRDMNFSLDIIWLNRGVVVDIAKNLSPLNQDFIYYPRAKANLVLELPAGWVDKNNLKIGDELYWYK